MSTHKHIDAICLVILALTLLLTVFFMNGETYGIQRVVDGDSVGENGSLYFTENDMNGAWDTAKATQIRFADDRISVSGGGAYAFNGNAVISSKGKYVVSGTLTDGSIVVDADSAAKVWILLNGVDIHCLDDACIRVEQADKVFITLAEGTENYLTTEGFSNEAVQNGVDAALFSRDDLTLNGAGSLEVQAKDGHGIVGNDSLVITSGTIMVHAARDALHANDSLCIQKANLSLTAEDEGIDVGGVNSLLYLESGNVSIAGSDNGISAAGDLRIAGGNFSISAGNNGISATGSIEIQNGDLTVRAYDDGIRSDSSITISGGTIAIPECYEGIEAITVDISGGEIAIYPEDDGINANGAVGGFGGFGGPVGGFGGPGGPQGDFTDRPEGFPDGAPENVGDGTWPMRPNGADTGVGTDAIEASETWIHISGGSVTIENDVARDADGLDSNGDILITGGTVRISLVNSGLNSALDYGSESGGTCMITDGEVVACGSFSMAEGFDGSSTQCSILYNFRRGADAGTEVRLEDSGGSVILSYEVPNSYSSVVLSSPLMKIGETYTIRIGEYFEEVTLTDVSSSFGDAQSEGFGGPMNWGGMQFQRDDYWNQAREAQEEQAD